MSRLVDVSHSYERLNDGVSQRNATSPNESQSLGESSRSAELRLDDDLSVLVCITPLALLLNGSRIVRG